MRLKDNSNIIPFPLPRGPGFMLNTPGYVFVCWPWKQEDSEQQPCHKSELCEAHDIVFFSIFSSEED